jgi:hypothetical protein
MIEPALRLIDCAIRALYVPRRFLNRAARRRGKAAPCARRARSAIDAGINALGRAERVLLRRPTRSAPTR